MNKLLKLSYLEDSTGKEHEILSETTRGDRDIPSKKGKFFYYSNALKIFDISALLLAGLLGYVIRFGYEVPISEDHYLVLFLSAFVTFFSLQLAQAYTIRTISSLMANVTGMLTGGLGAFFLLLLLGFLSGTLRDYSRLWLLWSVLIAFALLLGNRILITKVVRRAIETKQFLESIVIVGCNDPARKLVDAVNMSPASNVNVVGIFDDRVRRKLPEAVKPLLLGTTDELLEFVRSNRVDRVVVTLPWVASDRINQILRKLRTVPVRVDLVPNDMIWQFHGTKLERLAGVPVLTIANDRVEKQNGFLKRLEDIIISVALIILISPLLVLIAAAIKLDSRGPALFKQKRHGYNNKIFEVYKFRSMRVEDATNEEIRQATRDDVRITRVGRFLRRSSLDELPQLFNVLKGDMSIVGPRPHAVQHNLQYGGIISEYFARHNVKPGITGWAQVNGLRGETTTTEKMHRRVDADLYYIENWSILLDLRIIIMTAITVWFQEQAY